MHHSKVAGYWPGHRSTRRPSQDRVHLSGGIEVSGDFEIDPCRRRQPQWCVCESASLVRSVGWSVPFAASGRPRTRMEMWRARQGRTARAVEVRRTRGAPAATAAPNLLLFSRRRRCGRRVHVREALCKTWRAANAVYQYLKSNRAHTYTDQSRAGVCFSAPHPPCVFQLFPPTHPPKSNRKIAALSLSSSLI